MRVPSWQALLLGVTLLAVVPPPAASQTPARSAANPALSPNGAIPQAAATPDPGKAREAYERGLQAERAGDWQAAFDAYSEAAAYSPGDRTMRLRQEFARFELVQQHTDRAERNLLAGRAELARAELRAALQLDPGFSVARERLAQLMEPEEPAPQLASLPPEIAAPPGTRDFDYRGTTRGAYEEIARQFGLTAAFDGEMADRQLRFRASGVDFATAMRLLAEQTNTFWTAVNSRTFFVTDNTPEKLRLYAPEVKQTILLPASDTPDDLTETARVVRDITGVRRSVLDVNTRTLTVRDTPQNVALAHALIQQIEQPRGEVLLDIEILEVDRQTASRIGITPPSEARLFSLSTGDLRRLEEAQESGTLQEVLESIFGVPSTAGLAQGGLAAIIPPLVAFGGGDTVFLATLPGAAADFSRTFSAVRQARRLLLRAQDGRPATFFAGDRFPITLALLSESVVVPPSALIPGVPAGAFPRTDTAVGQSPVGIAVADFDQDGNLDAAVANQADDSVSLLLGNGDGSFDLRADLGTGVSPAAVIAADLNADGAADLVVANQGSGTVSVFLGNGDGTFGDPTDFPTGAEPVALASADFNRDGRLDLAVANRGANSVSTLLSEAGGSFAPREDFPVGDAPSALAVGDFDNDGEDDLAVANSASNSLSVLIGDGDGGFGTRTDVTAGAGPSAVVAADFDGDGRMDLAVANRDDNTLSVFPGNGDGTFGDRREISTGTEPAALLAGDFNSDSRPDLVTANRGADSVSVFLGLGDGTFADRINIGTGDGPVALAAGDLNDDSLPDLLVANQSANTISAIRNTAIISVTPSAPLTAYPASEYVDLGLKVSATPRLHPDQEVTLNLEIDISALSGQNVNGIPILSNRSIAHTVRLREDQTSLLTGLIQTNRARGLTGLPGLAQAGIAGHLAGVRSAQDAETELVIAITPRRIRLARRTDRLFYAGRGASEPTQPEPPPAPGGEPSVPPAAGPEGQPPPGAPPAGPPPDGVPQPTPPDTPPVPQPAPGP